MSLLIQAAVIRRRYTFSAKRARLFFIVRPEWWLWVVCLCVWTFLVINSLTASVEGRPAGHFIDCIRPGTVQAAIHSNNGTGDEVQQQSLLYKIPGILSDGLLTWTLMIIAMMFPLLSKPARHVALSVKQRDRYFAMVSFIAGYLLLWAAAGMILVLLPAFLDTVTSSCLLFWNTLFTAFAFLLAAAVSWLPDRPVRLMACNRTIPIRIHGWHRFSDSFVYGLKTGVACFRLCWAPMIAMMLSHHSLVLMYIVTVVIIFERNLLPHTSKLPGYGWGLIAVLLLCIRLYGWLI